MKLLIEIDEKTLEEIKCTTYRTGNIDLEYLCKAIDAIKNGTPYDWIPVSKELPKREYENYEVTTSEGEVDIGTYTKEKGWSMCDASGIYYPSYKGIAIIAWRELPQPYKESEGKSE